MNDDWKDSVNSQLGRLHDDARKLLYGLIASFLFLGGAGFGLYQLVNGKLTDLIVSQAKVETRLDSVDRTVQSVDSKLDRLLDERRSNPEPKR